MKKILAVLAFALLSSQPAAAASRVWITEFATAKVQAVAPFATLPSLVQQPSIDISGGTSKRSAIFTGQTKYIRIVCEVQCAISGQPVTATTDSILLPALKPEYFGVSPNGSITVIVAP